MATSTFARHSTSRRTCITTPATTSVTGYAAALRSALQIAGYCNAFADTVRAVAKDNEPDWEPLDRLLANRPQCVALLKDYFSPFETIGRLGYTGSRFESLLGGGDRPDAANKFVADDLVAVSLLSVNIPAGRRFTCSTTQREALASHSAPSRPISNLLTQTIVTSPPPTSDQLWYEIRGLHMHLSPPLPSESSWPLSSMPPSDGVWITRFRLVTIRAAGLGAVSRRRHWVPGPRPTIAFMGVNCPSRPWRYWGTLSVAMRSESNPSARPRPLSPYPAH